MLQYLLNPVICKKVQSNLDEFFSLPQLIIIFISGRPFLSRMSAARRQRNDGEAFDDVVFLQEVKRVS